MAVAPPWGFVYILPMGKWENDRADRQWTEGNRQYIYIYIYIGTEREILYVYTYPYTMYTHMHLIYIYICICIYIYIYIKKCVQVKDMCTEYIYL